MVGGVGNGSLLFGAGGGSGTRAARFGVAVAWCRGQDWLVPYSRGAGRWGWLIAPEMVLAPPRLVHPRRGGGPAPRATRRAGPPPLAVEPQLLGVLAEGGDQLILVHRGPAFELQLPRALPELLEGALLIGASVRRALLLGRVVLGRSRLAVVAEGGDQLVLAHRRAALDLQLTRPLPELVNAALLVDAAVELAVLLGRLRLWGLRLLRVPLLPLTLGGFDEVLGSADALADGGLDGCHRGIDGFQGGVDLAGGDARPGQRELVLGGEGVLGEVEGAVHGAGEVEVEDGQPEGVGQLLGDGGPGADGVEHGGFALAGGAQEVALGVGLCPSFGRHVVPLK